MISSTSKLILLIIMLSSFSSTAQSKDEISYGLTAEPGRSFIVESKESWPSHLVFLRGGFSKSLFNQHSLGLGFKLGTGALQTSYRQEGLEKPLRLNFYEIYVFDLTYDYALASNSIFVTFEQGWYYGRGTDPFPGKTRRTVRFNGTVSGVQAGLKVPITDLLRISFGMAHKAFLIESLDSSKIQVNNAAALLGAELNFGY